MVYRKRLYPAVEPADPNARPGARGSGNGKPATLAGAAGRLIEFGVRPEWHLLKGKVAINLRALGFAVDDIAIISCKGAQTSLFSALDKVGKYALRKFTGDYDSQGNRQYTSGEIIFDSIYRFKGNQKPAVILVDVDCLEAPSARETSLLFCGMTRATARLDIVSTG